MAVSTELALEAELKEIKVSVRNVACTMTSKAINNKINELLNEINDSEIPNESLMFEAQCYANIYLRRSGNNGRDNT